MRTVSLEAHLLASQVAPPEPAVGLPMPYGGRTTNDRWSKGRQEIGDESLRNMHHAAGSNFGILPNIRYYIYTTNRIPNAAVAVMSPSMFELSTAGVLYPLLAPPVAPSTEVYDCSGFGWSSLYYSSGAVWPSGRWGETAILDNGLAAHLAIFTTMNISRPLYTVVDKCSDDEVAHTDRVCPEMTTYSGRDSDVSCWRDLHSNWTGSSLDRALLWSGAIWPSFNISCIAVQRINNSSAGRRRCLRCSDLQLSDSIHWCAVL